MFNIGDLIVYSAHGICQIDDICEKTYSGSIKSYYVLHPVEDSKLIINIPVDSGKVIMLEIMDIEEAEEILESFKLPGINWIEPNNQRTQTYSGIIKTGNRKEISKIVNTLIRKKREAEIDGRKLYEQDKKILILTQNILFSELALSLNTTFEAIYKKVRSLINVDC